MFLLEINLSKNYEINGENIDINRLTASNCGHHHHWWNDFQSMAYHSRISASTTLPWNLRYCQYLHVLT